MKWMLCGRDSPSVNDVKMGCAARVGVTIGPRIVKIPLKTSHSGTSIGEAPQQMMDVDARPCVGVPSENTSAGMLASRGTARERDALLTASDAFGHSPRGITRTLHTSKRV